jgi:hypothetical protein
MKNLTGTIVLIFFKIDKVKKLDFNNQKQNSRVKNYLRSNKK